MDNPTPRLSCGQCRQRKKKCDKGSPCSACKTAGVRCDVIQRLRLPRGKTAGGATHKSAKLEHRVARIEELLHQANVISAEVSNNTNGSSSTLSDDYQNPKSIDRLMAPEFWLALCQEVSGLRETIDDTDEDIPVPSLSITSHVTLPICVQLRFSSAYDGLSVSINALELAKTGLRLLPFYQERVDKIFKLLHWPSVLGFVQHKSFPHVSTAELCLTLVIQFTALCAMTDAECCHILQETRISALMRYNAAFQEAFNNVNIVRSPNIVSLQAFLLYLMAIRACGLYTSYWTYVPLLIRIGTALRLGSEMPGFYSAKDLELRRRLWYCICLLDVQAAVDRGTRTILHSSMLGPLPKNVDDSDLSDEAVVGKPSDVLTEMSYTIMSFESMICYLGTSELTSASDGNWERKLRLTNEFESKMRQSYINKNLQEAPFEKLVAISAERMVSNMHLLLRRPPWKQREAVPATDDFDVMEAATTTMEQHLSMKMPELSQWAWKEWSPWYALAIVLAELCKPECQRGYDRSYQVALATHERYSRPLKDWECGLFWRPITKLLRRVQRQRLKSPPLSEDVCSDTSGRTLESVMTPASEFTVASDLKSVGLPSADNIILTDSTNYHTNKAMGSFGSDGDGLDGLFDQLGPMHGISWMDWDQILGEDDFEFDIN